MSYINQDCSQWVIALERLSTPFIHLSGPIQMSTLFSWILGYFDSSVFMIKFSGTIASHFIVSACKKANIWTSYGSHVQIWSANNPKKCPLNG